MVALGKQEATGEYGGEKSIEYLGRFFSPNLNLSRCNLSHLTVEVHGAIHHQDSTFTSIEIITYNFQIHSIIRYIMSHREKLHLVTLPILNMTIAI